MRQRLAAWLAVLIAAVLVAACSTADFAYRNAGTLYDNAPALIAWSIDDYLDLTPEQKDFARARLEKALAWHRHAALPGYGRFLAELDRQVDAGLDAAALEADRGRLREFYHDIAEHLLPDAADLFAMLDASQVDELARRLAKADARMLEESRDSRERGLKRTLQHLEAWTGPLTGPQRELVKTRVRATPDLTPQRVAEWRARQAQLVALMRARPPRDAMVQALHALLFDTDAWRDPAYGQALEERDAQMIQMLADLARTLTPAQVAHIHERIRGLQAAIAKAAA
ncbi:MAG TPA: DUF6279 family lipoprotein [Usitatibacter sp.]|jgi:hypothetical protein|nr:DUF6279 family lipoprotein [Usitatibacter sp.]